METGIALAFWGLSAVSVVSTLMVVCLKNLFRAALFLVLSFLTVAGLFVLLQAEFLAAVQVLIYAGAISILVIFAIMLTGDVRQGNPSGRYTLPALILALGLLAALVFVIFSTNWNISPDAVPDDNTAGIADALFNRFVLPFEVASVLLLAAILGAIVLVKEKE